MPNFRSVYQDPDSYRDFICQQLDVDFEGQHFDRKQIGSSANAHEVSRAALSSINEHIEKTLSAFANATGGLLVVGIASNGDLLGIDHLSENQRADLLVTQSLRGASIFAKLHGFSVDSDTKNIALFMVEGNERSFCCRTKDDAAWIRRGPSTVRLLGEELEQLKRDRRIVEFERMIATVFSSSNAEKTVVQEFAVSNGLSADEPITEVLYNTGAIIDTGDNTEWTNAGLLFFAFNPQRILEHAYIRLLRFDCSFLDQDERPTPDFDRKFDGSITQQIRALRTFFEESAFFRRFERRSNEGGFISEPEYPQVPIDEAIVNAVAHRDYGISRPIHCEKYNDAFVVRSPGRLSQPSELPETFRLNEIQLESIPRNAKLMEWLRGMKDAKGASYVKALREGTRKMRDEMMAAGLPAPTYRARAVETIVILENDVKGRTAQHTGLAGLGEIQSNEFTNLYPLSGLLEPSGREGEREERRVLLQAICDKLEASGWVVDHLDMGRAVVHVKEAREHVPRPVDRVIRIIPAYVLNIRSYFGRRYLAVDYTVRVQTIWRASEVLHRFGIDGVIGLRAVSAVEGKLLRGRLVGIDSGIVSLRLFGTDDRIDLAANKVFPNLRRSQLMEVLKEVAPEFDLAKTVKAAAHSRSPGAARRRAERISQCVDMIRSLVFPLQLFDKAINMEGAPLKLLEGGDGKRALRVEELKEPQVEFGRKRSTANIREGITAYGSYKDKPKDLELVCVVEPGLEQRMRELVDRLRSGSYRFKGTERTFATRLRLLQVSTAAGLSVDEECRRLIDAYPEWKGDNELSRLMLVHTPEADFAIDDVTSPYYRAKRALFEAGIPCQMVDTQTLMNPDYKDLNLALNIVAKTGVTPWVLPESIPDADFFVGLSYTSGRNDNNNRIVGFANVFNQYGRWEFYSGGNEAVIYEERANHYENLVRSTLSKLELRAHPTVYFHYSAKFNRREREAIRRGARAVRPEGRYVFIWINSHHPVKLFDDRAETDGSVARGRYVIGGSNQIYLSTTGHNPYRRAMGTPQALEINVYPDSGGDDKNDRLDHRSVANQILSLTKLNWASTDALCGEPITIKYAKSIAYLTAAFERQGSGKFRLHEVLERTPWFI